VTLVPRQTVGTLSYLKLKGVALGALSPNKDSGSPEQPPPVAIRQVFSKESLVQRVVRGEAEPSMATTEKRRRNEDGE